jgi:hypothetical protein
VNESVSFVVREAVQDRVRVPDTSRDALCVMEAPSLLTEGDLESVCRDVAVGSRARDRECVFEIDADTDVCWMVADASREGDGDRDVVDDGENDDEMSEEADLVIDEVAPSTESERVGVTEPKKVGDDVDDSDRERSVV